MTISKKCGTPGTAPYLTAEESDKRRKRRWIRRLKIMKRSIYFSVCGGVLLTMGLTVGQSEAQTYGESESVTATCTDTPCPFGADLYAEAIVWPATFYLVDYWLGYSMSPAFFLPADRKNEIGRAHV